MIPLKLALQVLLTVVLTLLACLLVGFVALVAFGQDAPQVLVPVQNPPLAPDLTYADLVDILVTYDLVHDVKGAYLDTSYFGYTDRIRHTIHILDHGDFADRRDTVLHEALHVQCYALLVKCDEEMIEARSQEIYKYLFTYPR